MIQLIRYGSPEEARRRLSRIGVSEQDLSPLLRDLRVFLVRFPRGEADAPALRRALDAAGIPLAEGEDGSYFPISSREQAEDLERKSPGAGFRVVREAIERYLRRDFVIACRGKTLALSGPPKMMGILNVTPDSFSDGGRFLSAGDAVRRGIGMAAEGADIIDVGGESTRPGSAPVPEGEEKGRILPVIRALARETGVLISVDTTKASVAREAADAGASIINDTSALEDDPDMAAAVRETGCAVVLMHRLGTPLTMQVDPSYKHVLPEILGALGQRIDAAEGAGIPGDRILVDPGIGFGKRFVDNLAIHRRLDEFRNLGKPIVFGPSRKSFIGTITGRGAGDRAFGTAASVACAVLAGAHVVRVHDVGEMREVVQVMAAIRDGEEC